VNLILLFPDDFVDDRRVRLTGRRREHVMHVHRAAVGDALIVGVAEGRIGTGEVTRIDEEALEMRVAMGEDPP
jgi:16S rRNA U1498 N3-methylase RsmE